MLEKITHLKVCRNPFLKSLFFMNKTSKNKLCFLCFSFILVCVLLFILLFLFLYPSSSSFILKINKFNTWKKKKKLQKKTVAVLFFIRFRLSKVSFLNQQTQERKVSVSIHTDEAKPNVDSLFLDVSYSLQCYYF